MVQKRARPYKAVLVTWDDAEVSNEWEEIPDGVELEEALVETLGFLVKETEKYYWIASTLAVPHTNARTKVPKSMVRDLRFIKV
jgi:hypothetical protein